MAASSTRNMTFTVEPRPDRVTPPLSVRMALVVRSGPKMRFLGEFGHLDVAPGDGGVGWDGEVGEGGVAVEQQQGVVGHLQRHRGNTGALQCVVLPLLATRVRARSTKVSRVVDSLTNRGAVPDGPVGVGDEGVVSEVRCCSGRPGRTPGPRRSRRRSRPRRGRSCLAGSTVEAWRAKIPGASAVPLLRKTVGMNIRRSEPFSAMICPGVHVIKQHADGRADRERVAGRVGDDPPFVFDKQVGVSDVPGPADGVCSAVIRVRVVGSERRRVIVLVS